MQVMHFENEWAYCIEPSLLESKVMTDGGHGEDGCSVEPDPSLSSGTGTCP